MITLQTRLPSSEKEVRRDETSRVGEGDLRRDSKARFINPLCAVCAGAKSNRSIRRRINHVSSLRSWRDCKPTRNKVFAAEPTSERRSREENGERDFDSPLALAAPPPKLYFSCASKFRVRLATQATTFPGVPCERGWRRTRLPRFLPSPVTLYLHFHYSADSLHPKKNL